MRVKDGTMDHQYARKEQLKEEKPLQRGLTWEGGNVMRQVGGGRSAGGGRRKCEETMIGNLERNENVVSVRVREGDEEEEGRSSTGTSSTTREERERARVAGPKAI